MQWQRRWRPVWRLWRSGMWFPPPPLRPFPSPRAFLRLFTPSLRRFALRTRKWCSQIPISSTTPHSPYYLSRRSALPCLEAVLHAFGIESLRSAGYRRISILCIDIAVSGAVGFVMLIGPSHEPQRLRSNYASAHGLVYSGCALLPSLFYSEMILRCRCTPPPSPSLWTWLGLAPTSLSMSTDFKRVSYFARLLKRCQSEAK